MYLTETRQGVAQCTNLDEDMIQHHQPVPQKAEKTTVSIAWRQFYVLMKDH
jgi:hypothetical protein